MCFDGCMQALKHLQLLSDTDKSEAGPAMSCDGPTLADILVIVPHLLGCHVLGAWPTRGKGIRALRLVNKELGCKALTAVTSCSVSLGDPTAEPTAQQVVTLFSQAQLQTLEVIITIPPGKGIIGCPKIETWGAKQCELDIFLLTGKHANDIYTSI